MKDALIRLPMISVTTPRTCGACAACCKALEVAGIPTGVGAPSGDTYDKPAGLVCEHVSRGCSIYAARPSGCRVFDCGWLSLPELPDRYRPDRSGVILASHDAFPPGIGALVAVEVEPGDFRGRAIPFLRYLIKSGLTLVLQYCGTVRELRGTPENIAKVSRLMSDHAAKKRLPLVP